MGSIARAVALMVALCWAAVVACAQPMPTQGGQPSSTPPSIPALEEVPEPSITPGDQVEMFLDDQGLREVLAAQLRARLAAAPANERLAIAERLSKIYVSLMSDAKQPGQMVRLEQLGQQLIDSVPDAETYALRLDLAKARYLAAEEIAENSTLRLTTGEQMIDAERALRGVLGTFDQIGVASHRRVDLLERQEERGRMEGDQAALEALSEARRLRSLSHYYAGWTRYYLSVMSSNAGLAQESLVDFGWLLNAQTGQPATVDRLPKALLQYEHIARSAVGCAMASAARGAHVEAMRWLEEVDSSPDVPESVREHLFSRRIVILAESRRWADLTWQVERVQRQRTVGREPGRLTMREARLLAVHTLEALRDTSAPADRRMIAEQLAQIALADLVHAGEVAHVLDLVQRYGTAPMGQEGFIVAYVRGLQTYDEARSRHEQSGEDPAKPATAAALVNAYREAANLLTAALTAGESERFGKERGQCGIMLGFALFYAGDFEASADALEKVASTTTDRAQAQEALWVAIVSMDEGVEAGRPSLTERRDRLAMLFLREHPSSPRAAELLVRRASSGLIDDEQAVQILLAVERESPVYAAARRHASGLLYRLYRRAAGTERDFAAVRFADIAEEVIRLDRATLASARGDMARVEEATQSATFIVLRGRQLLDALLGASAPDLTRVEEVLDLVESTIRDVDAQATPEVREELAYRRLQIALARGDDADTTRRLDELRAMNGTLAATADRLIYSRAAKAWAAAPQDAGLARAVVASGQRVIAQFPQPPEAFGDPLAAALYTGVAEAAAVVWRASPEETTFRDLALRLDSALMDNDRGTAEGLRRLAELSEAAADPQRALDAWTLLMAGLPASHPSWFQARFESLRILSTLDPGAARAAMEQHKVLHPEYGPDPWGERLRTLDGGLGAPSRGEGTP